MVKPSEIAGLGQMTWFDMYFCNMDCVDSPRPFHETSLLVGSNTFVGYSMACGMHSNVA